MEADLRARGIEALYLFGSVARGDARPDSDVDLIFEDQDSYPPKPDFFELEDLRRELAAKLEAKVDLVAKRLLHARVARHAAPHTVRVF